MGQDREACFTYGVDIPVSQQVFSGFFIDKMFILALFIVCAAAFPVWECWDGDDCGDGSSYTMENKECKEVSSKSGTQKMFVIWECDTDIHRFKYSDQNCEQAERNSWVTYDAGQACGSIDEALSGRVGYCKGYCAGYTLRNILFGITWVSTILPVCWIGCCCFLWLWFCVCMCVCGTGNFKCCCF